MFEWSEEQLMIRDAVRQFVQAEIAPRREELEHGDLPPYDILRKLFATFGMDAMAREGFKARIEREKRIAAGEEPAEETERDPWTVLRSGPFRALEHEHGPEFDLDGNVVEPQPEDPWGRRPKPLPE